MRLPFRGFFVVLCYRPDWRINIKTTEFNDKVKKFIAMLRHWNEYKKHFECFSSLASTMLCGCSASKAARTSSQDVSVT